VRIGHPDRTIELEVIGDVAGTWDPHRLQQVLNNLVLNALKYGLADAPVKVVLVGMPGEVEFRVHNRGPRIEQSALDQIFDPLVRGDEVRGNSANDGSLGLGLHIAREISAAHGGHIAVRSDEMETVFAVRLPRLRPHLQ
jgi:signal transduction histidine kinase